MKNKFLYLLLLLITCFTFMENVFADDLDFTVSTSIVGDSNNIVKGKTAVINVNVRSDLHVSACRFEVSSDSGIEYVSANAASGYVLEVGSRGLMSIDGSVNDTTPTNMTLLQLNYKVNNDGKVTIKTLDCTSPTDNKTGNYDDVVVELKAIDDTTLSNMVVTGGTLSPNFSSNIANYSIKLSANNFKLDLTASNSDFQDNIVVKKNDGSVLDPKNIIFDNSSGQGQMEILVIVNDATIYKLLAVYEEKNINNTLSFLKINDKNIELIKGKYEYEFKISADVNNVKVEAGLSDDINFEFDGEFDGSMFLQTPSNNTDYPIIIKPVNSQVGSEEVTYIIRILKDSVNNNQNNNNQNTNTNPVTGGISVYLMFLILIVSLIGSIFIYRKNLESYK